MKAFSIITAVVLVIIVTVVVFLGRQQKEVGKQVINPTPTATQEVNITMKIKSPVFQHNQPIPSKYTCDGQNVNPPLAFSDIPEAAKSLVLIMDDPDAPMGTWVHWTAWNIPIQTTGVVEDNKIVDVVEGITSFGKPGYGGPCPPSGTHRYFFKLYALDTTLTLEPSATKQELEKAMEEHILAKSELIGLYSRSK